MKKAFTLAEVLITLGIIGVVAAITIPVLIKKYQMKTYEVAFKKEYSTIQNALNYLVQEESLSECYTVLLRNSDNVGYYNSKDSQCNELKKSLIKNLKLTQIPNDFKNIYKSSNTVLAEGGKLTNTSVAYDFVKDGSTAYMLPDGAVLLMYPPEKLRSYFSTTFILDVNGKKGPNKWGYDVFYMSFTRKENNPNIIINDTFGTIAEKGGVYPRTILTGLNEKNKAEGLSN